jgi:hypothetical protein
MSNAELGKVIEEAEYLQKPKNDGNHDNAIQDALDLTLHGDEAIYQPKKQPDYAKCDNNGDKWHFMFSNCFCGSILTAEFREQTDGVMLN